MDILANVIDVFLHLDKYLGVMIADYGQWTYLILFLIVFCETGLVVTPFLPGDSLLFAAGALFALNSMNPFVLFAVLSVAAILGDTINYSVGKWLGVKFFTKDNKIKLIRKEHLDKTHQFYEKNGGKTIIIARFIPIIRTFAPFVAGLGSMSYLKFFIYNVVGGIFWVGSFIFLGYKFADNATIKQNFTLVIVAIIIISVIPAVIEYWRQRSSASLVSKPEN